jgi:hypothetical protein
MPVETRLQRKRRLQREITKLRAELPPVATLCAICLGTLWCWDRCTTTCAHIFHPRCLADWLAINPTCPLCRAPLALPEESMWKPWLALAGLLWWLG